MLAQATAARQQAFDANIAAEGARKALKGLQVAEEDARIEVRRAEEQVARAAGAIVLEQVAPSIHELKAARVAYLSAMSRIQGLRNLFGPFGPAHRYFRYGSLGIGATLEHEMQRTGVDLNQAEVQEFSNQWAAFADRLRRDPDATWSGP